MTRALKLISLNLLLLSTACGDENTYTLSETNAATTSGIDVGTCVGESRVLEGMDGLKVHWVSTTGSIPLNRLFDLQIVIETPNIAEPIALLVDASMPAHGHGMNTKPSVDSLDELGHFRVRNMNLHMPGEWELRLLIQIGSDAQELRTNLVCSEQN